MYPFFVLVFLIITKFFASYVSCLAIGGSILESIAFSIPHFGPLGAKFSEF
jgi:hypothetical protein